MPISGPKSIASLQRRLTRALEQGCFHDGADADVDAGEIVVGDLFHDERTLVAPTQKKRGRKSGPFPFHRRAPIKAYFLAIAALTSSVSSVTRWLSVVSASVWPLL